MRAFAAGDLWFLVWSARWTVLLSLTAFAGGGFLGLVLALARTAPSKPVRLGAAGWIAVFQGTPLVMQLFLVFFGTTLFGGEFPFSEPFARHDNFCAFSYLPVPFAKSLRMQIKAGKPGGKFY